MKNHKEFLTIIENQKSWQRVTKLFDKLYREPTPIIHEEPDFNQLQREAVKSLFFLPDVIKPDEGFEVV